MALRVARGLQVQIPRPRLQEALGLKEGLLLVPHRVKYEGKGGVKTKQPEFCLEAPFTQRVEGFKGIQNLLRVLMWSICSQRGCQDGIPPNQHCPVISHQAYQEQEENLWLLSSHRNLVSA